MLNQRIEKAFNEQINREFFSAYLYLSMGSYCSSIGLEGFANWMNVQNQEETFHAMKMYNFVLERGGRVILETIEKPESEWVSPLQIFEETLKHERFITQSINELMSIAYEEKDHASASFLSWFVDEQVEEEANVDNLLNKLKLTKGEGNALFLIDNELKTRVFVPPVDPKTGK